MPLPPAPSSSPPFNVDSELLNLLAAQHHQQWQSGILTFCFSFALGNFLQFSKTDKSKELPASFVLLSFSVSFTILVALFIRENHARTSKILEKVAVFLAAATFCHATAVPFPLNLKLTAWTLFLISLFIVIVGIVPRHFNSCSKNTS
ncbi:hypothetical protein COLO4_28375 [Corchorus olitorius]|uniref:Transmembrane protein n=1 Tax=Corchorus olitorius TaxID=93759 RepID=A0A1R3HLD2_9ROSI|nr:hypothetical protein COLO4_28375 [Corchorus olitorius]